MSTAIRQRSGIALFPVAGIYPVPDGEAGSTALSSYHDLETEVVTLSSSWSNWSVDLVTPIGSDGVTVENLTPSVCSIENWPLVERVISGVAKIRMSHRGVVSDRALNMVTAGGSSQLSVTDFVDGSVGAHAWTIVSPLLASGELALFDGGVETSGNWNFGSATYNSACWAADFDFTGVSHKNSWWSTANPCGTMVTDRHAAFAAHFCPPVGTTLTFIVADGTKHTRTILAYNSGTIPGNSGKFNTNPLVTDIAVAVLSSDVPAGVAVYPIAGPWIYEAVGTSHVQAWVGFKLDQQRRVMLAGRTDTYTISSTVNSGTYNGDSFTDIFGWHGTDWGPASNLPAFLVEHAAFYAQSIVGDSGSPRFYPLSASTMALAGCVSSDNGGCPFLDEDIMNACITSADANAGVSTGYTVTVSVDPTA